MSMIFNTDIPRVRCASIEVDGEDSVVILDDSENDLESYFIWVWGDESLGNINGVYVHHNKYIEGVPPCFQRRYSVWWKAVYARQSTPHNFHPLLHHQWMKDSEEIYQKEMEQTMNIVHAQRKKKYHKSLLVLRWAITENTNSRRDSSDIARYILSFIYTKQYGI